MMVKAQWRIAEERQPTTVEDVLAILLENRGVGPSFLSGTLKDLEAYLCIRGMDEGAELMARHLSADHKVVLVGDYDCDGITSLAQMFLFLHDIGYSNHVAVVPQRAEGYGMPERAVREHPDAQLFVSMDCGTMDVKPITEARSRGADCIVIDHHEVSDGKLAPATVLINPKHPACPSAFKEFCSSGLTLLFLTRLRKALQGKFPEPNLGGKYLALAALGTVADLVPLVDANRILARSGLSSINTMAYSPLQRIAGLAGLTGKTLTAGHLGYYLGPRINAAGRMADARTAFEMLVAENPEEMSRLAQELNRLNSRRQQQEDMILTEVRRRFTAEDAARRSFIMADKEWPAGVIGIIASRVQQELHYGPTIIFSVDETNGEARGSARSVPGFNIHDALRSCEDLLLKWGGHKMAAGMTVALDRLENFRSRFEEVAQRYPPEVFVPKGTVDMELGLELVSVELLNALKQLEPHGLGNPTPTFAAHDVRVSVRKAFGRDESHLRLILDGRVGGVFWRGARRYQSGEWTDGECLDVIFQVEWDDFSAKPALNIKDIGHFF